MRIHKIDADNYPETLHRMFIVNAGPGFKLLWNSIKGFLDPKTSAKIHVLGNKYQSKLLEIIDASQLPDFLGGSCTCANAGGCLYSDKGPWNEPAIMQAVIDGELKYTTQIVTISTAEGKVVPSRLPESAKVKELDASTAESGSDMDDILSSRNGSFHFQKLTPVHEEVKPHQHRTYYDKGVESRANAIPSVEKAVDRGRIQKYGAGSHKSSEGYSTFYSNGHSLNIFTKFSGVLVSLFMCIWSLLTQFGHGSSCNCEGKHPRKKEEKVFQKPFHYVSSTSNQEFPCAIYPSLYLDTSSANVRKRLDRLEEKIDLLCKPQEPPVAKETLSSASVERMKTLEVELLETRKTLRIVLEKQNELYNSLEQFKAKKLKKPRFWC